MFVCKSLVAGVENLKSLRLPLNMRLEAIYLVFQFNGNLVSRFLGVPKDLINIQTIPRLIFNDKVSFFGLSSANR